MLKWSLFGNEQREDLESRRLSPELDFSQVMPCTWAGPCDVEAAKGTPLGA